MDRTETIAQSATIQPPQTDAAVQHSRKRGPEADVEVPRKKSRVAGDPSMPCTADRDALEAVLDPAKYDVQVHSVISSSKIQKKVASILRHLAVGQSGAPPAAAKPRVSVLRARSADAGKLISIAEIAKRDILTQKEVAGGRWYQYIALNEAAKNVPRPEGTTVIEETVLGTDGQGCIREEAVDTTDSPTVFERAVVGTPRVRKVAMLILFLSRVSIQELKRRYPEQTNG